MWSYDDYTLSVAPDVLVWYVNKDYSVSNSKDGVAISDYRSLSSWDQLPTWCPQEVVRRLRPKIAERLDAATSHPSA
jgi:hypothetical protein